MSVLARLFGPLNFNGIEKRRENLSVAEANRLQNERVLRDELDAQWEIVIRSPDPARRQAAMDEIDRLNVLLRAT